MSAGIMAARACWIAWFAVGIVTAGEGGVNSTEASVERPPRRDGSFECLLRVMNTE